jgi:hypothetical protein
MTIPSRPRRNRATREYHRTGAYPVERALPFLVERVRDPSVPDDVLTPVDRVPAVWPEGPGEPPGPHYPGALVGTRLRWVVRGVGPSPYASSDFNKKLPKTNPSKSMTSIHPSGTRLTGSLWRSSLYDAGLHLRGLQRRRDVQNSHA